MRNALRQHWPEYAMEAAGLGVFMLSACMFGTLIEYPASPVRQTVIAPVLRRLLMGFAMGLTASAIIYSPWGKQSGAHLNPCVTLTYFRLGKIAPWDAVFYTVAQFIGGSIGVWLAVSLLRNALTAPPVSYVVTTPGPAGPAIAFIAETLIAFVLMSVILTMSNRPALSRYTGIFASVLIAAYITLEAPLSGMSMNPARTLSSAFPAGVWTALWVYVTAPLLGMLMAAEVYVRSHGMQKVICAKLHHQNSKRCIFRHCGYQQPQLGKR